MIVNRIILAVLSIAIAVGLAGCAPRLERWPPAIDYEQLNLKMDSLRRLQMIGPKRYDPESWAMIELQLREAETYLRLEAARRQLLSQDILARLSAARSQILASRMRARTSNFSVLDRAQSLQDADREARSLTIERNRQIVIRAQEAQARRLEAFRQEREWLFQQIAEE